MNDRDRYLSTQRRIEENNKAHNAEVLKNLLYGLMLLIAIGLVVEMIL